MVIKPRHGTLLPNLTIVKVFRIYAYIYLHYLELPLTWQLEIWSPAILPNG